MWAMDSAVRGVGMYWYFVVIITLSVFISGFVLRYVFGEGRRR